jgi:hypothetical protein
VRTQHSTVKLKQFRKTITLADHVSDDRTKNHFITDKKMQGKTLNGMQKRKET